MLDEEYSIPSILEENLEAIFTEQKAIVFFVESLSSSSKGSE